MTALPRASGVQLHVTSLPVRDARPGRARVRGLAGGRRAALLAGPPARAARPPRLAVQVGLGLRGLARAPARPRRGGRRRRGRGLPRPARRLDRRTGRPTPAAGARWPTRCASPASGPRCARTPRGAACASSATCRSTSRPAAPTTAPTPSSSATTRSPGVPPDAYSDKGQLWGNPLYDWPALQRRRYRWWVARLRRTFELVDLARIDHFRGFAAYWAVPAGARDARGGRWARGPGRAVFDAAQRRARRAARSSPRTSASSRRPVRRLRDGLGFPGMAVLQFAFDPEDRRRPAPAAQPPRAPGPLHGHPRQRHAARLVGRPRRRPPP